MFTRITPRNKGSHWAPVRLGRNEEGTARAGPGDRPGHLPVPADALMVKLNPLGRASLSPLRTFSRPRSRLVATQRFSEWGRASKSPGVANSSSTPCMRPWGHRDTEPWATGQRGCMETLPTQPQRADPRDAVGEKGGTGWGSWVSAPGIQHTGSTLFISAKDDTNPVSRNSKTKDHS